MATSCGISHMFVHSCYSPDVVAHRSVPYPHIPCKTKRMLLAVSTHRLCKQCGVDCFHEYTNYAGVFVHAFVRTCGEFRDFTCVSSLRFAFYESVLHARARYVSPMSTCALAAPSRSHMPCASAPITDGGLIIH
jgi:hypothetical protein